MEERASNSANNTETSCSIECGEKTDEGVSFVAKETIYQEGSTGQPSVNQMHPKDKSNMINEELNKPENLTLNTAESLSEINTSNESLGDESVMKNINSVDGEFSNESSFVSSPLSTDFNEIAATMSSFNIDMLVKEYERLKGSHERLQMEYKTSLEREKVLCEKLKEYGGQDDESCNSLANVNSELREELKFILAENQRLRNECKSLQDKKCNQERNGHATTSSQLEKIENNVILENIEAQLKELKEERDSAREKLAAHDAAAKRAITALQKEMAVRVEQISKANEEVAKEKDALVVKLAKSEKTILLHDKKTDNLKTKLRESNEEIQGLKAILKQKEADHSKLQAVIREKDGEGSKLKEEVEKVKEEGTSQILKVKWAQNKLKQELEAHKETKSKLVQANLKIEEMKEEGEQIRSACQEMVKKYQSSEDMRSVQLDKALQEKDGMIKVQEHEIAVQNEIDRKKTQELEALKSEHRKVLGEISLSKTTVSMLEGKLSNYSIKNAEMEKRISALSKNEEELVSMGKLLNDTSQDLKGYKEQVSYYVQLEENLRKQLLDIESEAHDCKTREAELLSYTEKITEDNAHWKSQASDLQSRLEIKIAESVQMNKSIEELNSVIKSQGRDGMKKKEEFERALAEFTLHLEQKQKLVEELTLNFEEVQDEIKVQKRKSASTIKDLQRQLHHSKKRTDQLEEVLSNNQDGTAIKSRASSSSSLDRLSNDSGTPTSNSTLVNGTVTNTISNPTLQSSSFHSCDGEYSIVQPSKTRNQTGEIEVDKAVLVDRICRLQKAHAKKNEKLEFLEEHNRSLLEDIKKKNRVIQFYVVREDAGTLISSRFDRNKAEISRKGGIMASIYSSRVSDKDMTLDLSLEINRKLQAVVEDTLLKNITLKESLNTLGAEIAHLQDDLKRVRK